MWCEKYEKLVLVKDCEECLTNRTCDPICIKRGFVWGIPDNVEPRWSKSLKEAKQDNQDVMKYFDPYWGGNSHLPKPIFDKIKQYKKKPIPADIRWTVWERDNFTCQKCRARKYLTVDHIYPESKGGKLEIVNLQTLCKCCNSRKGNK